jgi:hypothetical protein
MQQDRQCTYSVTLRRFNVIFILPRVSSQPDSVSLEETACIAVAARSKAWVGGRWFAGIAGSNPAGA